MDIHRLKEIIKIRLSLKNLQIFLRLLGNYHFGQSDKFDPYIGLGLGYYHFKYDYKDASGSTTNGTFAVPGALALSGQLGAKYYVAPTFGLYAEVGYVGGSIAQIGITTKF